mgnify:CR=1 FL=1
MARNRGAVAGGALLLTTAGSGALQWFGGTQAPSALPDAPATVGGAFAPTDEEGGTLTASTWRHRFVPHHFGYRSCPDLCPTEPAKMVEARELLPEAAQARAVLAFAAVDPQRDDGGVFQPALIGLTGTQAETDAAMRALRVHHRRPRDAATRVPICSTSRPHRPARPRWLHAAGRPPDPHRRGDGRGPSAPDQPTLTQRRLP